MKDIQNIFICYGNFINKDILTSIFIYFKLQLLIIMKILLKLLIMIVFLYYFNLLQTINYDPLIIKLSNNIISINKITIDNNIDLLFCLCENEWKLIQFNNKSLKPNILLSIELLVYMNL